MIYNLADTFFIGVANDPSKTAAASLAFTLVFAMNCLSNLFGVGGGSLISRLLGERRDKDAARVASFSCYGTILVAAIYSLVIYLFMEPILTFLGATSSSMQFSIDYTIWVIVIGAAPTTLAMVMSHLLRSEGYATHASVGLGMGGILNIALDPLFMFVILEPGNEVKGAALATLISNVAVLVYFLVVYARIREKSVLSIDPRKMIPEKKYVYSVFAVGFPSALGALFACLSSIMLNNLVSGYSDLYGDVPVASVGIAKKIDMLPMNVGMGLCQGMMPLVAYNFSAKNYKRMQDFTRAARGAGIAFAILCIFVFEIFAEPIVRIFIEDPMTVEMSTNFLRILCIAVPLMITNFQLSFTFQAMGMGKESLILASLRQGVINIPLMILMNRLFGLYGVLWTQLISDTLTTAISFTVYKRAYSRLHLDAEAASEPCTE